MKGLIASTLTTTCALGLGACLAKAQKWTGSVPLGDVARELRIQRAKSAKKPRLFTNEDLIALRAKEDQSQPAEARTLPTSTTEANPAEKPGLQASANQIGSGSARVIPVDLDIKKHGEGDYIDRMSKVQVVPEGEHKDARTPTSAVKLAPAVLVQATPEEAKQAVPPAPTGQWAKAKFRIDAVTISDPSQAANSKAQAPGDASRSRAKRDGTPPVTGKWAKARFRGVPSLISGEPGPIAATVVSMQPSPRQDLGYAETASGRVEAIVAEGEHVGLVQETEAFVKNFHFPAPSPAELEYALAPPPPDNAPDSQSQVAEQAEPNPSTQETGAPPTPTAGVEVGNLSQPEPPPGGNGAPQNEASATLQPEAMADYAGDQSRVKPPENFQPSTSPISPPAPPDVFANRSTVTPIGYVEKAGGEKEAIVEFHDQVFLVHQGDLFADKFRVLRVTASSVEIVEEPTEASSAAIDRRRRITGELPPNSK